MKNGNAVSKIGLSLASLVMSLDAFGIVCPPGMKVHTVNFGGFGHHNMIEMCIPDPAAVPSQCALIYQNENYGGAVISLSVGQSINNMTGLMIERRSWHGYLQGWSGNDVSWDNAVSSAKIAPNCTLELYDGANLSGEPKKIAASIVQSNAPSIPGFADRTSSVSCSCGGLVPGGFVH